MRVLIVSAVYPPEPVVSGRTSAQIAAELACKGHEVTILTNFPNRPAGKLFPGYQRRLYSVLKTKEGYTVVRCFTTLSPRSTMASRWMENVSFGITSGLAALVMKRADVIYANTWPVFAAGILSLVARQRHIPMVTSIQDVYPDSMAQQGRFSEGHWIYSLLSKFDTAVALHSAALIVLSERMKRLYRDQRGVPDEKIQVVPNWTDEIVMAEPGSGREIRRKHQIPEEAFLLVYGGNVGYAAGVEEVIRAFKKIKEMYSIYLLIAGSGSQLEACRLLAKGLHEERVKFHTPWAIEETGAVYAAANALVLPTRNGQSLASVPSKLIAYMLAERPILAVSKPETELTDVVLKARAGWVVEPSDGECLANKMIEIASMDSKDLAELGRNARAYALQSMTAQSCLPKIIGIIESASRSS